MSKTIKADIFKNDIGFKTKVEALNFVKENKIYFDRKIKNGNDRYNDFVKRLRRAKNNDLVNTNLDIQLREIYKDYKKSRKEGNEEEQKYDLPNEVIIKKINGIVLEKKLNQKDVIKKLAEKFDFSSDEKFLLEIKSDDGKRSFITVSPSELRKMDDTLLEEDYYVYIDEDSGNKKMKFIALKNTVVRKKPGGKFFKFSLIDNKQTRQIEEFVNRYQIYIDLPDNEDTRKTAKNELTCLVHSLKLAGVEDEKLNELMLSTKTGLISVDLLDKFAKKYDYCVKVDILKKKSKNYNIYGNKESKNKISLCLIDEHYFINEPVPITTYSLKNFNLVKDNPRWYQIEKIVKRKSSGSKTTRKPEIVYCGKNKNSIAKGNNSFKLVQNLMKYGFLKPLKICDATLRLQNYKKLDQNGLKLTDDVLTDDIDRRISYYDKINNKINHFNEKLKKEDRILFDKYLDKKKLADFLTKYKNDDDFRDDMTRNIFFDFEASTNQKIHVPYMVAKCITGERTGKIIDELTIFRGRESAKDLLKHVVNNTYLTAKLYLESMKKVGFKFNFFDNPKHKKLSYFFIKCFMRNTFIAHNVTYDFSFLIPYISGIQIFKRADKFITGGSFYYYGIKFDIKDSYGIITSPLRDFAKMFKLKSKKEIMPHEIYTTNNIEKYEIIKIEEALKVIKKSEHEEFLKNLEDWNLIQGKYFDYLKYAEIYCMKDVDVLIKGYYTMAEWLKRDFGVDMHNFYTISSIATDYLISQGAFDDVYKIGGVCRYYLQETTIGGRCMSRNNKKYNLDNVKINDFDACALYISAMNRMDGFLKGAPNLLTKDQLNMKFLRSVTSYAITIKIKNIPKKYSFPLNTYKNFEGIREFSNITLEKVYDKNGNFVEEIDRSIVKVNRITLEDMMNFCEMKETDFEIMEGYYFDEGYNTKINDIAKYLFETRAEKKKKGEPIQELYKLMGNSSYGFTMLKEQDKIHMYIDGKQEMYKHMIRYFHCQPVATEVYGEDIRYELIEESLRKKAKKEGKVFDKTESEIKDMAKRYEVTYNDEISKHYNSCHIGSEILAYSKRIMNEVMCLAEDIGVKIYYQDTDSMHIEDEKIVLLGKEFKKKYNRELIGDYMGQFHNDFNVPSGKALYSDRTIILGKKAYLDRVVAKGENGNEYYHYHARMKGISSNILELEVKENFNGDYIQFYEKLFNNEFYEFDLNKIRQKCHFAKDGTMSNIDNFHRIVSFIDYKNREDTHYFNEKEVMKALENLKEYKNNS